MPHGRRHDVLLSLTTVLGYMQAEVVVYEPSPGEGGFGVVKKGTVPGIGDVAVKRLRVSLHA